ncbi:MAG: hypothetical protein DBX06_06005 [Candidatus Poseidoniales archaeon]|nr:MAG: hypothetical protein DBX06_06290 [Candidatus Poseidoniales archaeon]RCH71569.1 MAG: hypothetical protein DBX06_06005 [Candidatus Poseidoniales archaeon]
MSDYQNFDSDGFQRGKISLEISMRSAKLLLLARKSSELRFRNLGIQNRITFMCIRLFGFL